MARQAPGEEQPTLDSIENDLARGADGAAIEVLLSLLDARTVAGDRACALAARALRRHDERSSFAPDAMAAAVDRLVHLVREQEAQIKALRAMVETGL